MVYVAGVDGAPGGWAIVSLEEERCDIQKVGCLSEIFDRGLNPKILAVDIPIGLLDRFVNGGRDCDREARKCLGKRRSSVFSAPVRPVLKAADYKQACDFSRASAENGGAISKQTWGIVGKIKEVDDLLRIRPALREIVHEVHPEMCFCELAGGPMNYSKKKRQGRDERLEALNQEFRSMNEIITRGRKEAGLAPEDVVDAAVACWSALRLATGKGRSLIEPIPRDSAGLPMTIWV